MLFQTTAAHEELRAKIRSFAEEEIKPLAFLMDQNNEFPEEAVKKLGKLGWMGIPYPKEYGGAGLDALSYAIAVEELARVDGGTETTALDKGDYYLLNGGKIFITNAPKADTYVVFAIITPDIGTRGISAFIVEKGWKGFEFGDNYDKMGIRSSSTAELIFNDVKVPMENLLGK
jgi:butyryl-CoA dehydrogenase